MGKHRNSRVSNTILTKKGRAIAGPFLAFKHTQQVSEGLF